MRLYFALSEKQDIGKRLIVKYANTQLETDTMLGMTSRGEVEFLVITITAYS